MMSLFSSFDLKFFSTQYLFYFLLIMMIFNLNYKISLIKNLNLTFHSFTSSFFSSLKPKYFTEFTMTMLNSTFLFLIILNFSSVMSFSFSFTSQTSVVILIAFGFWLSMFIFQLFNNIKGFISHCVPEGTPIYLTWFLFLIELVSNSIRPITLMVRLVANILAGHLLMILLSNLILKILFLAPLYMILNLVEIFVALIQSYIFVTMTTLYFSDVN